MCAETMCAETRTAASFLIVFCSCFLLLSSQRVNCAYCLGSGCIDCAQCLGTGTVTFEVAGDAAAAQQRPQSALDALQASASSVMVARCGCEACARRGVVECANCHGRRVLVVGVCGCVFEAVRWVIPSISICSCSKISVRADNFNTTAPCCAPRLCAAVSSGVAIPDSLQRKSDKQIDDEVERMLDEVSASDVAKRSEAKRSEGSRDLALSEARRSDIEWP